MGSQRVKHDWVSKIPRTGIAVNRKGKKVLSFMEPMFRKALFFQGTVLCQRILFWRYLNFHWSTEWPCASHFFLELKDCSEEVRGRSQDTYFCNKVKLILNFTFWQLIHLGKGMFSSVQWLSRVRLFAKGMWLDSCLWPREIFWY